MNFTLTSSELHPNFEWTSNELGELYSLNGNTISMPIVATASIMIFKFTKFISSIFFIHKYQEHLLDEYCPIQRDI